MACTAHIVAVRFRFGLHQKSIKTIWTQKAFCMYAMDFRKMCIRDRHYTDYIYKPLYVACKHWCLKQSEEKQSIPSYEKCTICFLHQYDKNLPISRIRDHDNYEEKHVLDVLANFFMATDRGLYVDTYHMTRLAEKDGTLIYVMDSNRFCGWLSASQL